MTSQLKSCARVLDAARLRHASWTQVDLTRIRNNAAHFRRLAPRVMAVIKADAYGHGAEQCARASLAGGASEFAVARVDEALQLREQNIVQPMLVLGLAPDAAVSAAVQANVALCIWSEAQLRDIERAANALRKRAIVHVKVNSGMTRLGVDDERSLVALAKRLRECHDQGSVQWRGVFTHIACGDAEDAAPTLEQLERFSRAVDSVRNLNLMPSSTLVHAANSATSLRHAHGRLDMVRVGIALYGLAPCRDETPTPADVKPALSWFANIAQRRALQRGTPVSYGWTYRAQWDNELHLTLSVGYADGFRRCANNKVVIGGVVCDIVGRVTMDSIVARVPRGLEAHTVNATFAELLSENHTADDVARIWNTINYEVTCAIHKRVPQFHFHAD